MAKNYFIWVKIKLGLFICALWTNKQTNETKINKNTANKN